MCVACHKRTRPQTPKQFCDEIVKLQRKNAKAATATAGRHSHATSPPCNQPTMPPPPYPPTPLGLHTNSIHNFGNRKSERDASAINHKTMKHRRAQRDASKLKMDPAKDRERERDKGRGGVRGCFLAALGNGHKPRGGGTLKRFLQFVIFFFRSTIRQLLLALTCPDHQRQHQSPSLSALSLSALLSSLQSLWTAQSVFEPSAKRLQQSAQPAVS